MDIPIHFQRNWQENFLKRIDEDGPWANLELFQLAYESKKHTIIPEFHGLQAPKYLPDLTPLPHQLEVATKAIEEMNGKAILADEVGLGKTIEAGLILKEYMIRGLVKKALILVPASLVTQWAYELNKKFYIPAVTFRKKYKWADMDIVISSLDTAKRTYNKEQILDISYDLVIIDEAHKLKNNQTKNYEFVQLLKKKFCLLLTATPIQNKVEEIFNLVSLLKPGHLGNQTSFTEYYAAKNRSIQQDEHLKALVNKVMVRNRRTDTGIHWTKRHIHSIFVEFSQEERELYDLIHNWKRETSSFSKLTFKREACSSREAVFFSIKKMLEKEEQDSYIPAIMEAIHRIPANSKAQKVLEIIQKVDGKVIIFTEYRATQMFLQWFLQQHHISSVPFRGGFKQGKKDWMKEIFKDKARVLIATEAGGEGINLQFCHHMINYDLPWNPMRLEQRIGRIHRLGQTEDVHIYNFATKDTIEEHIFNLLYEKIQLFERVVGELDDILTKSDLKKMEKYLLDQEENYAAEGDTPLPTTLLSRNRLSGS